MKLAKITIYMLALSTFASDYYVSNKIGDDKRDGRSSEIQGDSGPLKTINKALHMLQAGDTLHIINTGKIYRQSINIPKEMSGKETQKITIEGNNSWITCIDPLANDRWSLSPNGSKEVYKLEGLKGTFHFGIPLYKNKEKIPVLDHVDALKPGEFWYKEKFNILYFYTTDTYQSDKFKIILGDGSIREVEAAEWGHTNYRHNPKLKRLRGFKQAPKSIQINGVEAPLLDSPALDRLPEGTSCMIQDKELYYRPHTGEKPVDMMAILRPSGVTINHVNEHITFKNLNVAYTSNDGYNIHGKAKQIRFENCNAFFTGDEGFSSHGQCETTLDGGIFLYCSNGIHNVNNSSTIIRNVIVDSPNTGGLKNDKGTVRGVIENSIAINCPIKTHQSNMENILAISDASTDNQTQTGIEAGENVMIKSVTIIGSGLIRVDKSSACFEGCILALENGRIHIRDTNPKNILVLKNSSYSKSVLLEWGKKPPFQKSPLVKWGQENPENMVNTTPIEIEFKGPIQNQYQQLPHNVGCSKELFNRYIEYRSTREELLKTVQKMVWPKELEYYKDI